MQRISVDFPEPDGPQTTTRRPASTASDTPSSALKPENHFETLSSRMMGFRVDGSGKAVVATGHQILEIAYYVMRDGVTYHELGGDYFQRSDRERTVRRHVKQLEALGYRVTVQPAA